MKRHIVWPLILTMLVLMMMACVPEPPDTQLPDPDNPLLRETQSGLIEGVEDVFDTYSWRGVPFAAPPVGALRWQAPRDPQSWEDVLDTKAFPDICPQYVMGETETTIQGSEDCLYLNIWKPREEKAELRPVYVWIHGGGNSIQMPFNSDLTGAKLAQRSDFVVVHFNYRLGPLGWFVHPALKNGDPEDDSGNYGTLDIIKVLQWIQDNIEGFGGDPDNVTIAGESAGGLNVMSMLISEKAKGLFHKGIAESGGPVVTTMKAGQTHANMLLAKLLINDCLIADESGMSAYLENTSAADVSAYLRSKSAQDFLKCYDVGLGGMISAPNIFTDGTVIQADGFAGLRRGNYANKVPMIIGTNTYEAKLFLYSDPAFESVATGQPSAYLIEKYGDVTQEILDSQNELFGLITKYASDLMTASGVDGVAGKLAQVTDQPPVYTYQFNWGAAAAPGEGVVPEPFGFLLGACHGTEIEFFFGLTDEPDHLSGDKFENFYTQANSSGRVALQNAITDYIAAFVRTGDPNPAHSDLPKWSPWKNTFLKTPKKIIFDADLNEQTIKSTTEVKTAMGIMFQMMAEPRYKDMQDIMAGFLDALIVE